MGRQLDSIIAGLAAVTGSTGTINVNLDAIEALLTTIQADIANGIDVTRSTTTSGTLTASTTNGTLFASNASRNYLLVQCTSGTAFIDTNGTATAAAGIQLTSGQGITFEGGFIPTGAIAAITSTSTAQLIGRQG
jgi:hypothetical protein